MWVICGEGDLESGFEEPVLIWNDGNLHAGSEVQSFCSTVLFQNMVTAWGAYRKKKKKKPETSHVSRVVHTLINRNRSMGPMRAVPLGKCPRTARFGHLV